jgi:hypothetical protein
MLLDALRSSRKLHELCREWRVGRLQVFGSGAEDRLGPDSDVDLLVEFEPGAEVGLWDHHRLEVELAAVVGRPVDLLTRRSVEDSRNPYLRESVLGSAVTIYEP